MTWSPTSNYFYSNDGSPPTYRRIFDSENFDRTKDNDPVFSERSPTLSRKLFRELWGDSPSSTRRFGDRPRLLKKIFKPSRWETGDKDFERTKNNVRQFVEDFAPEFNSYDLDSDFNSKFRDRESNFKRNMEDEFGKTSGKVHHIPITVERRSDKVNSNASQYSPHSEKIDYDDDSSDLWQRLQKQKLKKRFEDEFMSEDGDYSIPRVDLNKYRDNPKHSKWNAESASTLPIRRSHKNSKFYDDVPPPSQKSVFRSYSETHEDVPKPHQQHTAAFRSHSDGHCPKTYVTKITVNASDSDTNSPMTNGKEELLNHSPFNECNKTDSSEFQSRKQKLDDELNTNANVSSLPPKKDSKNNCSGTKMKTDETQQRSSMQQITAVLQNVDDLIGHVEAYNGTGRDKQFRFLDEMLTRCMLRLDDVDTEGKDDIRIARKAAVMQVQSCIEKLEAKANECEQRNKASHNNKNSVNDIDNFNEEKDTNDQVQSLPAPESDQKQPEEEAASAVDINDNIEQINAEDNEQTKL